MVREVKCPTSVSVGREDPEANLPINNAEVGVEVGVEAGTSGGGSGQQRSKPQ